ncbi:MAG: thiamine-phosphate kinase, partial [Planctomycetota bacterium]
AVARAVSDIAAMGAEPVWGLATGLLPSDFEHGDQLFDAMAAAARTFNCPLVGGDIAACPPDQPLSLTVTAAGRMPVGVEPVLRSGAQPGDQLWLTGLIGNSYTSGRHLTFEPRVTLGKLAATTPGVRAMMDISDGLGIDADRIARASNIIIDIDLDAVPLHADVTDPLQACADGEDYELLIAAAPTLDLASMNDQFRGPIGVAQAPSDGEQPHAAIVTDGKRHLGARLGWDHGQESHDA